MRALSRSGLAEIILGAAWLVGIGAAVRIVEIVSARNPLMSAVLGAVLVDLAAGRAGVRWSGAPGAERKAERAATTSKETAREIGFGLGLALAATGVALLGSVIAGWATVRIGAIVSGLPFAAARAAAVGVRDELLYRGTVLLFAARAGLSPRAGIAFAAIAGGAAIAFAPGASAAAVLVAIAAGIAFGALWTTRRGAMAAVAAHAGWNLFAGAGIHGALLDATFTRGDLGDGVRAADGPAFLAALAWMVIAATILRRSAPPRDA